MQNRLFKLTSILLITILLLSACSGEPDRKILTEKYEANNHSLDCIVVSSEVPDSIVAGDGFIAKALVTNTCNRSVDLIYGVWKDLLITQTDGTVLWQHDQNLPTIGLAYLKTLKMGESFQRASFQSWTGNDWQNKTLTEGDYQAVMRFGLSYDNDEDRQTITILESVKSFKITN